MLSQQSAVVPNSNVRASEPNWKPEMIARELKLTPIALTHQQTANEWQHLDDVFSVLAIEKR